MGTKILGVLKLAKNTCIREKSVHIFNGRCIQRSSILRFSSSQNESSKGPPTDSSRKDTPRIPDGPGEHLTPPGGFKTYIVKKYVGYIERFEVKVEKHYPRFYKVYKLFKTGIAEFFLDTQEYSIIATRIWAGEDLNKFTWKQLEIYRQMPSDLLRSAPVLIAAPLPAVPYFFYPICYMFPRQLLCRYFWSPSQREEFGVHYLRQRLLIYPHILEMLERNSTKIRDKALRGLFLDILYKLEHDSHPTVEELLEVKSLFVQKPFGLDSIPKLQLWYVARSLDFSTFSRKRFMNDAILLHNIDLALQRKGIETLTSVETQQSCFHRGHNTEGCEITQLQQYLQQWTELSSQVNEASLSLLLHAPVLLSHNKPSNRKYMIEKIDVRSSS